MKPFIRLAEILATGLILIIPAIVSCDKGNRHPVAKMVEINIEENVLNVKPLYIGDFDCDLRYVPLKGNSIQLRTIILTDFYKDFMLVTDRFNCLLCDLQGNMIAKIGNKGKGPGEYFLIQSMRFGPKGQIYLQETWTIHEYDMAGNFIRDWKPEVNPERSNTYRGGEMYSWAPFNDTLFIGQVCNDSGHEKYKAVFFNEAGKTVRTVPNHVFLNKKQFYTSSSNADADIYRFGEQIHFKEYHSDTLFLVKDHFGFEPVYYFNLGKYALTKEVRELPMQEMTKYTQENCISIRNVFETRQFLFLNCSFNDHTPARRSEPISYPNAFGPPAVSWFYPVGMLGVYNKSTKELVFAEPVKSEDRMTNWGLKNDYDGGPSFHPKVYVNDSTLGMWVDAFDLMVLVASKEFKNSTPRYPEKKRELEMLAKGLSDNDNPVLIQYAF